MIILDAEQIIRKNKEKRRIFVNDDCEKKENLPKNLKYIKGLVSRTLIAVIFVLGSIIFTNLSDKNKELYKNYVLENSLSFTKINNLYQDLFGKVDILSKPKDDSTQVFFNTINYSDVENYKNGVKLTIGMNETVNVITSGIVVYIGQKEELGNTIIIRDVCSLQMQE